MATKLVELRIPVPDRPGVLAEVTTLAGRLGVNVADFEIAHSNEGGAGVLVLIVAADDADAFEAGLHELGYRTGRTDIDVSGPRVSADVLAVGGARPLRGRLRVPGDKSISHRALIFAALADGTSTITNLATGADVRRDGAGARRSSACRSSSDGRRSSCTGAGVDRLHGAGRRARLREQRHDDARCWPVCSRAVRSSRC